MKLIKNKKASLKNFASKKLSDNQVNKLKGGFGNIGNGPGRPGRWSA